MMTEQEYDKYIQFTTNHRMATLLEARKDLERATWGVSFYVRPWTMTNTKVLFEADVQLHEQLVAWAEYSLWCLEQRVMIRTAYNGEE